MDGDQRNNTQSNGAQSQSRADQGAEEFRILATFIDFFVSLDSYDLAFSDARSFFIVKYTKIVLQK